MQNRIFFGAPMRRSVLNVTLLSGCKSHKIRGCVAVIERRHIAFASKTDFER
jgi:hypothetical protein